jgi:flagellin
MTISVNTNSAALIALENLNTTNNNLAMAQSQISTGLAVGSAKDNASVWAIAQQQRADVSALGAVTESLNRATSIADVAQTAGTAISDLLNQIKAKIVSAMDPSQSAASRALLNNDYQSLLQQIANTTANASFDGANMLDGSVTGGIKFLANTDGTSVITLSTQNMSLGGGLVTMAASTDILTVTNATAMLTAVDNSITNVNSALGDMGSQANEISTHTTFVSQLTDTLQTGIGNLVDADMAKESASLQALQVQQQLGAQALSIANSTPNVILSLFKSS